MKKIVNVILKIVFSLILLMPILGVMGVFPAPTPDLYNNAKAFEFIKILTDIHYINIIMAIVSAIVIVLLWMKRVALAALLILPITVNIVSFHAFLDGGPFTAGAIMANVLFLINVYFIWQQRKNYLPLFGKE